MYGWLQPTEGGRQMWQMGCSLHQKKGQELGMVGARGKRGRSRKEAMLSLPKVGTSLPEGWTVL